MSMSLEQYETLNPKCELEFEGTKLTFATPTVFTRWRVESIFTKEPWTIEWLNELTPQDLLACSMRCILGQPPLTSVAGSFPPVNE